MSKIFIGFPYSMGAEYRKAMRDSISSAGYEALFADDIYTGEHIWNNITKMLDDIDVRGAVFDITGLNPNVLIEIGYSKSLSHPTILILNPTKHLKMLGIEKENIPLPIPEDLSGIQRMQYDDYDQLHYIITESLREAITSQLNDRDRFERSVVRLLSGGREIGTPDLIQAAKQGLEHDVAYQTGRNWLEAMVIDGSLKRRDGKPVMYRKSGLST